ncbi:hypothetical protein [Plantactinospora sp. KBS50]|uniref:hypothetical protein n=1 Tax=Plantactinospora sp. KBS50 TaxID=2024580 RepID=UPI0012FD78AA|nr:hypothetical protein [Plantactinospora sp. KBS50]
MVDPTRVAVGGHSIGGANGVTAALRDLARSQLTGDRYWPGVAGAGHHAFSGH